MLSTGRIRLVTALAAMAAIIGGTAQAAPTVVEKGMVRFVVGEPAGSYAELLIKPRFNSRHVITINLVRAAKPGARVELKVDGDTTPLLSAPISPAQCRAEVCSLVVPGHGAQADAIVTAFKAGRVLHVDVRDGGDAMMQASGSLMGFMAAFRQASR